MELAHQNPYPGYEAAPREKIREDIPVMLRAVDEYRKQPGANQFGQNQVAKEAMPYMWRRILTTMTKMAGLHVDQGQLDKNREFRERLGMRLQELDKEAEARAEVNRAQEKAGLASSAGRRLSRSWWRLRSRRRRGQTAEQILRRLARSNCSVPAGDVAQRATYI